MALWAIGRAIFGAAANFLPALREASPRARARLGGQSGEVEGGGHQGAGVGMLGAVITRSVGPASTILPSFMTRISCASARTTPQIVADEEIGEAMADLQFAQQFDDLRLHRHVECRGRLVEHQEAGFEHQCPGDGDALALAAGEFVRVALGRFGVEPDLFECRFDQMPALGDRCRETVHFETFFDDLGDREPRRQARERVLEDHLHLTPQWPQLALTQQGDVLLAKRMWPRTSVSRNSASPNVVLPEPLSPTTPRVVPERTASETPSTALT